MKRSMANFISFLLFVTLFAFVGCQGGGETKATVVESSESTLVIRVEEVTGEATLYEVMTALKEDGKLDFVSELSSFGQSLVSINGVENAVDWSWYWASYTTDADNGTDVVNIGGTEWYYSAAGISVLKVKAGESYMFQYIEYVYEE